MAKVLGKPGRFVENQSVKRSRQYFLGLFIAATVVSGLCGFYVGVARTLGFRSLILLIVALAIIGFLLLFRRLADKNLDAIERERISFRKGAVGEALIGYILEGLPDEYVVIHDLRVRDAGNCDHVVVGPTGVYVIDTKNWKGIVSADGNGELLLNGKPTDKPTVKPLVGRTMGIRDKVIMLCSNDEGPQAEAPFFRAVLAFPSAKVQANWGETGRADCVSDEKVWDYIAGDKRGRVLSDRQVASYARAFTALARMDADFEAEPEAAAGAG
jgi:hypothetical protein